MVAKVVVAKSVDITLRIFHPVIAGGEYLFDVFNMHLMVVT